MWHLVTYYCHALVINYSPVPHSGRHTPFYHRNPLPAAFSFCHLCYLLFILNPRIFPLHPCSSSRFVPSPYGRITFRHTSTFTMLVYYGHIPYSRNTFSTPCYLTNAFPVLVYPRRLPVPRYAALPLVMLLISGLPHLYLYRARVSLPHSCFALLMHTQKLTLVGHTWKLRLTSLFLSTSPPSLHTP